MNEISMAALRNHVITSRERVKFAAADPYGHLGSGAYVDMIMSHRVEALEDVLGFSIVRYAAGGVALPTRRLAVSYEKPAFVGEVLEVGSWIEELRESSFEVRAIVSGAHDRRARALASMWFVTVDSRTGQPVPVPENLPSSASSNPLPGLPTTAAYLQDISGVPATWPGAGAEAPVREPG